jgi:hypothetical protein
MILWGDIRQFPLFTVLQFLASQRVTGVLEIQDFEDVGAIYLNKGRIEMVSSGEWDERLGARLVVAGALTESQVKECWMEAGTSDDERPAVALLLERAEGEHRALREIVDAHTGDMVMELMSWNTGTFRLATPARQVKFPVVPLRKTDEMLLEAFRRVDEGERPWREKMLTDEELCLTCTIECSEEIKSRYLKADLCLWRSMPSILKDTIYKAAKERRSGLFDDDAFDELPFI